MICLFFDDLKVFLSLVSRSSQWYFGPDIKLGIQFAIRENLQLAYAVALTSNLVGLISIYFSISIFTYLLRAFLWVGVRILPVFRAALLAYTFWWIRVRLRLARIKITKKIKSNSQNTVVNSLEESRYTIAKIIALNAVFLPPFGTIFTAGTFVYTRSYGRGLWGIILVTIAKIAKVHAIAAIGYMYQPITNGLLYFLSFLQPANITWAPIWSYLLSAYAQTLVFTICYFALLFKPYFNKSN